MVKILDCTLRDGGYYNNWDFCPEVVSNYLQTMASAKIDYVELGLRNFPRSGFSGPYAYTTEIHLRSLDLPVGPMYGVMVDAKTILASSLGVKAAIDALFLPAKESKVSLVRVAGHFREVEECGEIVKHLKELGYKVGFNLMQAGGKACNVISQKAQTAEEWEALDVLYFADSLGNMDSKEVVRIVTALKVHWKGEIGIHTHNNMGRGLDNTLAARDINVTWLDSTVTGMGRGAGNTQTENLLAVLDKEESLYNPKPVYELVIRDFEKMQKKYGWGGNLLYFLAAQNNVHPTYIQNLLLNPHYGTDEIVGAIDYLNELEGSSSYDGDVLKSALLFNASTKRISGEDKLQNKFLDREVMIVSNGPSLSRYLSAIESYISERKPIVIAINAIDILPPQYIDYYAVSHNNKFLSEHDTYKKLKKPIVLPAHLFADGECDFLKHTYFDYGLSVTSGQFSVKSNSCVIPYDLTAAYAIAIAINGKPKKISLVGFDGYDLGDIRQVEMIDLFSQIRDNSRNMHLVSLTPTSYNIQQGSVYAPDL
ncbi:MAG: aldolase catalytic domain-containing protein [Candidatus Reddybacter sp.]